ncbi:SPT8-like protein [Dichotomopilus funicola]|uniref:SPT8-like protein n=1 Tax=Dichotomopilus funicola TaxID=1934379 RepID=A0AAN6V4X0_9PEZI|nr:SPT8-like protein [Dichotomopilus funicola]
MDDEYASSENDQDELMEDAEDLEAENENDNENENEEENEEEEDDQDPDQDADQDQDQDEQEAEGTEGDAETAESFDASQAPTTITADPRDPRSRPTSRGATAQSTTTPTAPTTKLASTWHPILRQEYIDAPLYDIVPTMAAPQATSVNAMAITPDLRYWITGGSDGYIRKYDGMGTINGKQQLTVAQRHPFVDSVTKAGILMSYWENEEPAPPGARAEDRVLSPVYSLAVQRNALWLLSGLESGGINLQSVRHDEGKRIHCLKEGGHTNAVSVLQLATDEKSVLSGSWDKTVLDWDLNTGNVIRKFESSGGQISAIELRPASGAPVPKEASEVEVVKSETFFAETRPRVNGFFQDGGDGGDGDGGVAGGGVSGGGDGGSPEHESLFGSPAGSLFGDNDTIGGGGGGGGAFGDDDDEFSRAMDMGLHDDGNHGLDHSGDFTMGDADMGTGAGTGTGLDASADSAVPPAQDTAGNQQQHQDTHPTSPTLVYTHPAQQSQPAAQGTTTTDPSQSSPNTFLTAAIDGAIRLWDRRTPDPIARINNRRGVPPWCMGACWSPDGNHIYAGRRNGTVEEYAIHNATSTWLPERTLKFPAGSGAVSCVRPMANGRHLVCASHDILRLYDLKDTSAFRHSKVPFIIIPGPPRAGVISQLYVDPTSRIMISTAGTRGWDGSSTEVLIGYEIGVSK